MTARRRALASVPDRPPSDEQVIRWAAEAASTLFITARTAHQAHQYFDSAKEALARSCPAGSGHLIESVELWPNIGTDGTTAGILITVDLPAGTSVPVPGGTRLAARSRKRKTGPSLCTLQVDLDELVSGKPAGAEEFFTDLITNVLSYARDTIDAHRRALRHHELTEAVTVAQVALADGTADDEHHALAGLTDLVAGILDSGQL
jgi:hypothetical protein